MKWICDREVIIGKKRHIPGEKPYEVKKLELSIYRQFEKSKFGKLIKSKPNKEDKTNIKKK